LRGDVASSPIARRFTFSIFGIIAGALWHLSTDGSFCNTAGASAVLPAFPYAAQAQTYPSRPVRIIVGNAAGGSPDIQARLIGQWLSERLGQPFIIENRPGGGTNIATDAVVRSPADGYTLLLVTAINTWNATLYDKLNFNFVHDIAPVAGLNRQTFVMDVPASLPARTVPEFIAYAKANPGKINMASSGNASAGHVTGELFKMMAGVDMLHVPYRGTPPAQVAMFTGEAQIMFDPIPSSIEHIKAGKLRALAVTGTARAEALPDVPAMNEFLPGFEAGGWQGIGVPRNTPAEIIEKLNKEINAGLTDRHEGADRQPWGRSVPNISDRFRQADRGGHREVGQGGPIRKNQSGLRPIPARAAAILTASCAAATARSPGRSSAAPSSPPAPA
jgi:tripartite-type tricarboxylate transporter receptor subunit TctC